MLPRRSWIGHGARLVRRPCKLCTPHIALSGSSLPGGSRAATPCMLMVPPSHAIGGAMWVKETLLGWPHGAPAPITRSVDLSVCQMWRASRFAARLPCTAVASSCLGTPATSPRASAPRHECGCSKRPSCSRCCCYCDCCSLLLGSVVAALRGPYGFVAVRLFSAPRSKLGMCPAARLPCDSRCGLGVWSCSATAWPDDTRA